MNVEWRQPGQIKGLGEGKGYDDYDQSMLNAC
jgi:hypothetical protein